MACSCEDRNEPLGFLQRRENSLSVECLFAFVDEIRSIQLVASEAERVCFLVKKTR
jgi:hypothetical protein